MVSIRIQLITENWYVDKKFSHTQTQNDTQKIFLGVRRRRVLQFVPSNKNEENLLPAFFACFQFVGEGWGGGEGDVPTEFGYK
jgi:hypothetical protein